MPVPAGGINNEGEPKFVIYQHIRARLPGRTHLSRNPYRPLPPNNPRYKCCLSAGTTYSTLSWRWNNTWQTRSCACNPSRRKTFSDAAGRISKVARQPLLHSGESLQGKNAGMVVEETWPRRRGALLHAVYRNTLCDIIPSNYRWNIFV